MYKAFGIVNSSSKNIRVEGLEDYRPIGAFSFLGRYRVVDFPISNLSNSGIDRIQVYVQEKPRTLVAHIGTGRHYNINSKSGKLQILFSDTAKRNDIYNTDISAYYENLECIEAMHHEYVVITPDYMVYSADFSTLIEQHIDSGADITLLYHSVDNAKEAYLNCNILNLNKQRGVLSIEPNHGNAKNRNIFMDTYIMKKDLLVDLIKKARATSSAFTLADIINELHNDLDVRGISHRGFFASITDFQSYYDANMDLIRHCLIQSGRFTHVQTIPARLIIMTQQKSAIPLFPMAVRLRELLRTLFSVVAASSTRVLLSRTALYLQAQRLEKAYM